VTSSLAVFEAVSAVIWMKSMYIRLNRACKRQRKRENMEIKEIYINLRLKDRLDVENSQIANASSELMPEGGLTLTSSPYM